MKPIGSLPVLPSFFALKKAVSEHILMLDGAMGTQLCCCDNCNHSQNLINDILNISDPDKVTRVHGSYLPYADIIETNTFNANAISLADYGVADKAFEINLKGARIARTAADRFSAKTGLKRFVAGSMGPTSKLLSMARRFGSSLTFDNMADAYRVQAEGLISGGADILLIETALDMLNVKAAINGAQDAMEKLGINIPLSFSFTVDKDNRILTGATIEAMAETVMHTNPFSIGLNCGAGAEQLIPLISRFGKFSTAISLYPNAGLPDELGQYGQTPSQMAGLFKELFASGTRVNIIGGCCGTTPEHIAALSEASKGIKPLPVPPAESRLTLCGTEVMRKSKYPYIAVGERCNVAGSRKFLRLISEKQFDEALSIAKAQVENGAQVLDVNTDSAMLDAAGTMSEFLSLVSEDPQLSALPIMIDSSDPDVIGRALKIIPGRPIVNSISLKDGEANFLKRAFEYHRSGAAVVVMAFDELGQATNRTRRTEICRRSVNLLLKAGLTFRDFIFDPNILTIATGIPEHDIYGKDLLDAISDISAEFPNLTISGGLSNLSFAFRGNDYVRGAIHAVFLKMAVGRGLGMAILNPGSVPDICDIPKDLADAISDVLLNKPNSTNNLVTLANLKYPHSATSKKPAPESRHSNYTEIADSEIDPTIKSHLFSGTTDGLTYLLERSVNLHREAYAVVTDVLLKAMGDIGDAFSRNEIFLPQVVRSASVMKEAMEYLSPLIETERAGNASSDAAKIILATVRGDVHDIGKNIVAVVLRCNGFNVIDLGVMVPPERIIAEAKGQNADAIAVSGLITPSLSEMSVLAGMMQQAGMRIPLFVGGATTSERHTSTKIAPLYPNGKVIHTSDAATLSATVPKIIAEYKGNDELCPVNGNNLPEYHNIPALELPPLPDIAHLNFSFGTNLLRGMINWRQYLHAWGLPPKLAYLVDSPNSRVLTKSEQQALKVINEASAILDSLENIGFKVNARAVETTAAKADSEEAITLSSGSTHITLPLLRQSSEPWRSISDYYNVPDKCFLFSVSTGIKQSAGIVRDKQSFNGIAAELLLARLTEAATALIHKILTDGTDRPPVGIRPAVGYPSLPDQSVVFLLNRFLDVSDRISHPADTRYGALPEHIHIDVSITETGALSPSATTLGLIIPNPSATYFSVLPINPDSIPAYANQRKLPIEILKRFLP